MTNPVYKLAPLFLRSVLLISSILGHELLHILALIPHEEAGRVFYYELTFILFWRYVTVHRDKFLY